MKAEIISVGTELLLGHVINSDAAYVARALAEAGIGMTRMQVVGDNRERLLKALHAASLDNDLIITTGGLGPTKDDLTRDVCAEFAHAGLHEDQLVLKELKKWFGNAEISENQFQQAQVPEGAIVLPNEMGTAPGLVIPFGKNQYIILLPGPPAELVPMLERQVKPFLEKMSSGVIESRIIRTFGIGEGQAAQMLTDLLDFTNPTVAPYASEGEMFVKITAKAANKEQARNLIEPVAREVMASLGNVVYGEDVASLEEVVVNLLIQKKLTVATAESCTGGLLSKRLTDRPGSSAVFHFGAVTYSNEYKQKVLSVSEKSLREYGAVSPQVAEEMAVNVRELANADFGIGITGIAGPDGGTPEKPVGLVYIALAFKNGCEVQKMLPAGRLKSRDWIRNRAASTAMDMLRRFLLGLPILER